MDQTTLRRLPEEFQDLPGSSAQRALLLVYRHWGAYPEAEQDQLANILIGVLEPLAASPSTRIPERLRDECERLIHAWEMRAMATDKPPRQGPQAPAIAASPARHLKFISATVVPLEGGGYGARVTLERPPGEWCVGFAQCEDEPGQLRAAAEAALDGLRQAVPERGLRFELRDVGQFETCGHVGVLVDLLVRHQERNWPLVGLCARSRHDIFGTAALAVLNGTNRLLRTG
jgi:hypothetical protein